MTIARKISIGYGVLLGLLVLISAFSLYSLNRLNVENEGIIGADLPVIDNADAMIEALLAEERYARRALILEVGEVPEIFRERAEEFNGLLGRIRNLPESERFPLDKIESLHNDYITLFTRLLEQKDSSETAPAALDEQLRTLQRDIADLIGAMARRARESQQEKSRASAAIGTMAFRMALALCTAGFLIAAISAILVTRNISGTINKLKQAAGLIVRGEFDRIPRITQKDELGNVAIAFITMAKRLKRLEDLHREAATEEAGRIAAQEPAAGSSDVRPLTGLSGGNTIETTLSRRIEEGADFAVCRILVDNLRAYNERYGYARGDTIIQAAASVIEDAVATLGNPDDQISHQGGDTFAVITDPDRCRRITDAVRREFDEAAPWFYEPEDRERGYIVAATDTGTPAMFPFVRLVIAVVTSTGHNTLKTPDEVGEILGQLQEYGKTLDGSVCVVDTPGDDHA